MTDLGGRVLGDRYLLTELIARGEDSEVWLAADQVTGRHRAVKLFTGPLAMDAAWREAFNRDARKLEALTHPGIVTTLAAGEEPTSCWLAMAYVEGGSLAELTAGSPSVGPIGRIDLLGQVALAVSAAHDAGITHGALEASNLLVADHTVVTLVGFVLGSARATTADDLGGLRQLVADCLPPDEDAPAELQRFTAWVATADAATPTDAAEIGRVALALAASLRAGREATVVPVITAAAPAEVDSQTRRDTERRRLRNRLLVVGAIVVIGGGFLLRFVGEGGGQVTVPSVVDLPVATATLQLTSAGLKSRQQVEVSRVAASGGTVQSQSPSAGERVKAGSTVTLTISESDR